MPLETIIRPMAEQDLDEADGVMRLAFGTEFGLPDPARFMGDAKLLCPRWRTNPAGCLVAQAGAAVIGSVAVMDWGSVAVLGPLSVHPARWNQGLARRLLEAALATTPARLVALYTQPGSPRHLRLYEDAGFATRHLIAVMAKPVAPATAAPDFLLFSQQRPEQQAEALAACREISNATFAGLDLSREIRATTEQGSGDTLLLRSGNATTGFALCQEGAGSEAGSGTLAVKFGAVRPGDAAAFQDLLAAAEALASRRGARRLQASVTHARRAAYARMKAAGFRTELSGIAMVRPEGLGYDAPESFLVEEWR
ncbi:GNAT family N-acetyltransferase [Roseomonas sp. E05]|uniref:GNAT family N-acetyltransferase n=1 Tax=Roseomonas sp. E05 TaxID=3046310 RepID=UPI0024BAD305|nr:GNAT family N-acetyltransferase [Roseomonas sp. E05]MDJ0386807.1 GNAT family N-acetyltransferase [Roseomonas sp. E05]